MRCDPRRAYEDLVKPSDGPISRHINRRVSVRITCFLVNHGVTPTPNKLTIIIALIGLSIALLPPVSPVTAGILVELVSILDGVDGELARLTGRTTVLGGFLDSLLDRIVDAVIISSTVLLTAKIIGSVTAYLLLSWLLTSSLLVSYIHSRGEAIGVDPRRTGPRIYAGRDVRLFLIALALIIQPLSPTAFLALLIFLAAHSTTYIIVKAVAVAGSLEA